MESKEQEASSNSSQQEGSSLQDQTYRLVKKEYYCHFCQQKFSKLVTPDAELTCEKCQQGFCEIMDKQYVKEHEQKVKEDLGGYRMVFGSNNQNRLDINNMNTSNLYGAPEARQEEEKKQPTQQQDPQQMRPSVQITFTRRRNPYAGPAASNFFEGLFIESPYFVGMEPGVQAGPFQRPASRLRNPFRQEQFMSGSEFFDQFYRPFSLHSIFQDDPFQSMFDMGFDQHNFATNFSQNFRSMGLNDLIQRAMEDSAREQQNKRKPTAKEALQKLPVVSIAEKHCKKDERSGQLEAPQCTICYEELPMGAKAMFLPCGHTFHPDCIVPWLKDHNTCPICRFELPTQ